MPVIVFIIDNSASMNQTTYLGTSYLDIAKSAVENFLKIRARDTANARNDRYMLLTVEEPPKNIKVGWKENMNIFTNELKNLKAMGLTNINPVMRQAFDLLNLNRLSSGMDTFGLGRCPFYLEPSLIITITDGCQLMDMNSTYDEINIMQNNIQIGNEVTTETYRWDQRFFLINLNMSSVPFQESNQNTFIPYATNSPINGLCEVTGGRSYSISSQRMLNQCLESLVTKIQAGVVLNFEKHGNDPPPMRSDENSVIASDRLWEKCRKMIFIPRNPVKGYAVGHWPIPEDYWISLNCQNLPKRYAHPLVKFKCDPCEPMASEEIPFDRYELEPSPLTQYILERRQANVAWQCFIPNSSNKPNDIGYPFGYLKASTNLMSVNLFVLPYNYPVLIQLMNELFQTLKLKPTKAWTDKFDSYLKNIPPYYYAPLRRVLSKKGLQHLIAENLENCLSFKVQSQLKMIKIKAKEAFDQVNAYTATPDNFMELANANPNSILFKRQQMESYTESKEFTSWLTSHWNVLRAELIKQQFIDFSDFKIFVPDRRKVITFRAPAEIKRKNLIETLKKMRENFYNKCKHADEDELHSVPIQDMGNYHEYLKNQVQPLRELETQLVRKHMFGNPFKLVSKDQKSNLFGADEVDEFNEESAENNQYQQQQQQQQKSLQMQQLQQQQQALANKRPGSGPGNAAKRRGNAKGPLSRKINYMKNLYSSNSSNASLISNDTDVEFLDETSSVASGFSTIIPFNDTSAPSIRIDKSDSSASSLASSSGDIANLKDFNDILNDYEMMQTSLGIGNNGSTLDQINNNQLLKPRPMSSLSILSSGDSQMPLSSELCDNYIEQSYVQTKILCIEQIKRPSREHSQLFQFIHESHLTTRLKLFLIKELIYEASRFKRHELIKHLTKFAILTQQYALASGMTAPSVLKEPILSDVANNKE